MSRGTPVLPRATGLRGRGERLQHPCPDWGAGKAGGLLTPSTNNTEASRPLALNLWSADRDSGGCRGQQELSLRSTYCILRETGKGQILQMGAWPMDSRSLGSGIESILDIQAALSTEGLKSKIRARGPSRNSIDT